MDFYPFNADYIRRLRERDAATEEHFAGYFGDLMLLKLRGRLSSRQAFDDVRQETLLRVLGLVRRGAVRKPERFGAFVSSICENVLREFRRQETRYNTAGEHEIDSPDERIDLELPLISADRMRRIQEVLEEIPVRDRELLRAVFLEERDKYEVCRQYHVDGDYLRVLLHRAKSRFRKMYGPQT